MQLNLIKKLYFKSNGTYDVDISYLHFDNAEDYLPVMVGRGHVPCNDPSASPPVVMRSGTAIRVVVDTGPAEVHLLAYGKNIGHRQV